MKNALLIAVLGAALIFVAEVLLKASEEETHPGASATRKVLAAGGGALVGIALGNVLRKRC